MQRPFYLFLFILAVSLTACHHQPTDSAEEMARTDSLLSAHTDWLFSDPKKACLYIDTLQSSLTDSAAWHKAEVFRGTALGLMGDSIKADSIYRSVLHWSQQSPAHPHIEGLVWNHRGVDAMIKGNLPSAHQCYSQAYALLSTPPKAKELISTSINLADICLQMGQMPPAAQYYRYALFLCDSLGDNGSRSSVCSGLGQVYMELENYDEAHHFFSLAAEHINQESLQNQFFYHFTLGNCFYYERRYDEALASFEQARHFAEGFHDPTIVTNCDANLGEIYLALNQLDKASIYLTRCRQALTNPHVYISQQNQFYIKSLLADLAIARGNRAEAKAIFPHFSDSLFVSTPRYLMLHYRRLKRYAERDGLWRDAYRYQSLAELYADSINSRQTRNAAAELAGRYQRDTTLLQQRLAIADYATQNVRQQYYIILSLSVILALVLTATLIIVFYRRRTQERLKQQMERMTELRMDIVRNRVSPHYIFNVLGTVLPKLQRYPEMVEPVENLIDVLRDNLLTSGKVAVPLRDELTLVRRYVNLYHYSRSAYPIVTWDIQPKLQDNAMPILSMSLQIPVENALKHAFPNLTPDCAIHISANVTTDNVLVLRVTDNGQGYDPGRVKRTDRDTGTGLRLLTRTIEILNQYNSRPASLTIVNVAPPHHGTCTELRVPVEYSYVTSRK